MPIQSSYLSALPVAFEGMVANSETATIISRVVETSAGLGFGKIAMQGVADNGIVVSVVSGIYRGITVMDPNVSPVNPNAYAQRDTAAVMTKGVIWVLASVAVTPGQAVYFTASTGVFTNVSSANIAIPNAIFDSTAAIGGLVKVRLG